MAEPITIKKKKLTIKSKAVKTAAPAPAADGATPQGAGGTPHAPITPFDKAQAAAKVKQPSYVLVGILAILATLMFIGLVAIQWTEFSFLQSAFPRPIQTGF